MKIEGDIAVRLDWDGRRVSGVTVRSTRPVAAARVLAGKAPAVAVATVPLLFSVCGRAQGAAAIAAVDAAQDVVAPPHAATARELPVLLETIQEYLWRILIDWPKSLGRDAIAEPVAAARRWIATLLAGADAANGSAARRAEGGDSATARAALAQELDRLVAQHIYGESPRAWLARSDRDAIEAWAQRGETLPAVLLDELLRVAPTLGRSDVALMPAFRYEDLAARVLPAMRANRGFERAPDWNGVPMETGALARMHAHPLMAGLSARCGNAAPARMAARLVELAVLVGSLAAARTDDATESRIAAFASAPGEGLAAVHTARGLLLHRVRLAGGRVADYQIVAPTEWNFHPDGPLARGLLGHAATEEPTLLRDARLAVQALDPCVACEIEVAHA